MLKNLDKRQKIVAIITAIVMVILFWQLYLLLWGGAHHTAPVKPSVATKKIDTKALSALQTPALKKMPSIQKTTIKNKLPQALLEKQKTFKGVQNKYIQINNALESAKMEHQLLSEQLAVLKIKSQLKKLGYVSGNTYDANNQSNVQYRLVYIDKQNKKWTAALQKAGKFYSVHVGDYLPDQTHIINIDQKGVVLKHDQKKTVLRFN